MYDGAVPLLLALTLAGTASAAVAAVEVRWLPYYQAAPDEPAIRAAFGPPDQIETTGEGERELYYRRAPGFPGGVDVWFDPKGRLLDVTFFVAPVGRIWTRDAKLRAARIPSPIALSEVAARYGRPDADKAGTGRRTGIRRLVFEEPQGDATRSVTFGSLPFSKRVHTVTVGWERP